METGIEFVLYLMAMAKGRGKQRLVTDRGNPLSTVLWRKPQKMAFKNSFYFVTDRSFTADVGQL